MTFAMFSKMAVGDEVLQAVGGAERNRERQHHREAGVNGAGDEVRREQRVVPAGDDRHREVETDHRVDGDDQRRGDAGEQQVGGVEPAPVTGRAAPADRQNAVGRPCRSDFGRDRGASRGRESDRCTRRGTTRSCRSTRRRRPTAAGCGTAARGPSCWGRASASRRAKCVPSGAAGTCRRRRRRTASSLRRSG